MMQRIVLEINMSESEKLIKKAMKIASAASGVKSVAVQGQNDQYLVVVGEGIETAKLTSELNKKVCKTSILTVQTVQSQPNYPPMGHEMPQGRRCICEIPNSGFCGFCTSMNQNTYQMVPPPYPVPVIYGSTNYRNDPDGCIIM